MPAGAAIPVLPGRAERERNAPRTARSVVYAGLVGVGVLQVMALAVAFTGVAIAAVNQVNRAVASRQPVY